MESKPHVVIIPFPSEEHVDPMLKFAKILHAKGFYITFVHSEYNYQRLLNTRGPSSLDGLPDFRFETFLDGIPSPEIDRTKDLPSLLGSIMQNGLPAIRDLVVGLNNNTNVPPITYIVSDNVMSFTFYVAKEISVPLSYFWATSACGLLGYLHLKDVVEKGLSPLKDEADLVNGYLETRLDWIPGMNNVRLKDMSSFIRTTDANDFKLNLVINESKTCYSTTSIIINTFQDLDSSVLEALSSLLPPVYEIGPLDLLYDKMIADKPSAIESMGANLSKEDPECLEWLDTKALGSVVYVYVECISMMTNKQLTELAWGLCNSNKDFVWINISPEGDMMLFPEGFLEKTKERSMFSKWCSQNDIFNHPAIGGLVTNCYYNSMSKSICGGVPMLCLPIFGEQMTNCRYSCVEWNVGLEIDSDVKRDEVTSLITELMDGEKGKDMRTNAKKLKAKAIAATQKGGSSFTKMNNLVDEFQTLM